MKKEESENNDLYASYSPVLAQEATDSPFFFSTSFPAVHCQRAKKVPVGRPCSFLFAYICIVIKVLLEKKKGKKFGIDARERKIQSSQNATQKVVAKKGVKIQVGGFCVG